MTVSYKNKKLRWYQLFSFYIGLVTSGNQSSGRIQPHIKFSRHESSTLHQIEEEKYKLNKQ